MSNFKKIILFFFCSLVVIPYNMAQNADFDKKKSAVKPFFSIDANFGVSTKKDLGNNIRHSFNSKVQLNFKSLVYGANFAGGIELQHYFKIGLGLGYLFYGQLERPYLSSSLYGSITHGIPLFLYLRSDFLDKKITPYVDFKIGNNFLITRESFGYECYGIYDLRLKNGLFLASNIGVAFKIKSKNAINISVGYRYVSRDYDVPIISYGEYTEKREYYKTGYIAIDHQFLFNVGVSF